MVTAQVRDVSSLYVFRTWSSTRWYSVSGSAAGRPIEDHMSRFSLFYSSVQSKLQVFCDMKTFLAAWMID